MEEIEIRGTLTEIAGIYQKQMFVQRPLLTDQAHTTGVARTAVSFGFNLRMGVIRVQDGQMVLRRASDKQHGYYAEKERVSHGIFNF